MGRSHPCRIGPLASGAAVLEDRSLIEKVKKVNRKLIGIEMETYGVYVAGSCAGKCKPKVFSAKSICDLGDTNKNDDYQSYAAYTSANFIFEFAKDQLMK